MKYVDKVLDSNRPTHRPGGTNSFGSLTPNQMLVSFLLKINSFSDEVNVNALQRYCLPLGGCLRDDASESCPRTAALARRRS